MAMRGTLKHRIEMPTTYSCAVVDLHLSAWRFSNFFISRTPKLFIYFLRIPETVTTNNEWNNRRAAYEQNAQVVYSCRHLHNCLLNIWRSVSFVVLTTFSYNSGSQPVGRDPKWVANSSLNSLLSLKFLELRILTFCVTSAKAKHRQIFVKFTLLR